MPSNGMAGHIAAGNYLRIAQNGRLPVPSPPGEHALVMPGILGLEFPPFVSVFSAGPTPSLAERSPSRLPNGRTSRSGSIVFLFAAPSATALVIGATVGAVSSSPGAPDLHADSVPRWVDDAPRAFDGTVRFATG